MSAGPLAFFLPSLAAGGAERVVLAVAGELARQGMACELLTAQGGGRWARRVPPGVDWISLDRGKPIAAVPALARHLSQRKPAALLSTVFAANIAALLAKQIARSGTRTVIREAFHAGHDVVARSAASTLANRAALRLLYPRADAVIALSAGLGRHVQHVAGVHADRVHVIPNPRLPLPAAAGEIREDDLIVACGRLELQKDFATLLQAVARTSPAARVAILGEGSQRNALEALARSLGIAARTSFPGYCEHPVAWMRRAHVFVSSSRLEGFPNALLEARDAGCHVVSTASSDAVDDILESGARGRIVPVGDVDALSSALSAALSEPLPSPRPDNRYDLATIARAYLRVMLPGRAA